MDTHWRPIMVNRFTSVSGASTEAIYTGSLVARIVFQPIEEASRVFFAKSLASVKGNKDQGVYRTTSSLLMTLLLLFSHLLLLLAAFAPPYLPIATAIFLPPRYRQTSAPRILGAYIYYVPTMAFNGVLEAFFSSACTPTDLQGQSRMMMATSAGFVAASFVLSQTLGMGDVGLVWANVANLGLRAFYAWTFARRFFAEKGLAGAVSLSQALPPAPVMAVFAAAAAIVRASAITYGDVPATLWAQKTHIGVGGAVGVICLLAWFVDIASSARSNAHIKRSSYVFERARLTETLRVLRSQ